MFSKSRISRRLAFIRGKVAAARAPQDLEAELSNGSRISLSTSTAFVVGFGGETDGTTQDNMQEQVPRTSIESGTTVTSSCSMEIGIGPNADPNNFFIDANTGRINKRSKLSGICPQERSNASHGNHGPAQNAHLENAKVSCGSGGTAGEHSIPADGTKGCSYLTKYIELMYYFGVSPYKTQRQRAMKTSDLLSRCLHFIQKALFWYITIMSGLHSLANAKGAYLRFMVGTGLYNFVDFCFYFITFVTKAQAVYVFAIKENKVDEMIDSLETYQSVNCHGKERSNRKQWLVTASMTVTIICVAMESVGFMEISDYSPTLTILDSAHIFAEYMFIWSSRDMITKSDELTISYGTNTTATTMVFGISTIVGDLASNLQMDTLRDLLLIAAVTNYMVVLEFIKEIEETMGNVSTDKVTEWTELQKKREESWIKYRELKKMQEHTNDAFGTLLNVMHVDNLLLFAFFAAMCIEKENVPAIFYVTYAYNLTKLEITYYIASKMAEKNDTLRKWMRNWGRSTGRISVSGESWDIAVVLDELDKEPLGLGKGNFLIQESFHFKFLGYVGSLSLLLADDKMKASI